MRGCGHRSGAAVAGLCASALRRWRVRLARTRPGPVRCEWAQGELRCVSASLAILVPPLQCQ